MKTAKPTPAQMKLALERISKYGQGMDPNIVDWINIGKNSVNLAKETLREKCKECGK